VVIQKSIREGFGLTVTEALWKARPVVASNVGGIPLQIQDGDTGYLLDPGDTEGFVRRVVELLSDPDKSAAMGVRAREMVREKFLITRLLNDYILLLNELL
jgi:trehalose synthase